MLLAGHFSGLFKGAIILVLSVEGWNLAMTAGEIKKPPHMTSAKVPSKLYVLCKGAQIKGISTAIHLFYMWLSYMEDKSPIF